MWSLNNNDPAPSRLGFKAKRLWRRPGFRFITLAVTPAVIALGSLGWMFAQPEFRQAAIDRYDSVKEAIISRPEFAIRRIEVIGGSPEVTATVHEALTPWIGASSLAADTAAIRAAVGALGWVDNAGVRLVAPETLIVTVTERTPALVWRHGDELILLDATGSSIAKIGARADRADLPLIAGEGAAAAAQDALAVFAAASGVKPRLRGLVRVGQRRWDAIIEDGPRIMLPASGAAEAIAYVATLDVSEKLLERDLVQIDLRIPRRPTLRLTPESVIQFEDARKPRKSGKDA